MDIKVALLDEFYSTMCRDKVKLETKNYGFDFLDTLTSDSLTLDYVQLDNHFIHKYRLLNIQESSRERLLLGHVQQDYNVCLYFHPAANNTLCFNLDNNNKADNTKITTEMSLATKYLQQHLAKYGIEPLVIPSGRGYHHWCRFREPIANHLLFDFMVRISAKTLASLHINHYDYHAVKFNMSPNPKVVNVVSLRLFGSKHIKTGTFSCINTPNGVLGESASWDYFRGYLRNKTVSSQQFTLAYDELVKEIPLKK